jgi:S-adenosyl-L-homocysteine hydrolase
MPDSTIRDPSLAPEGERKIRWVEQHAHTLNSFAAERLSDGALRGRRIAIAVHLEAKTAYLAWLFKEAGAEVAATGSNPFSTQDDVCAALVARGVTVHAIHGADPRTFDEHLLATLDFEPDLIVDDGAELVTRLHTHRRHLLPRVRGASEETTSGVLRLRAMEAEGALEIRRYEPFDRRQNRRRRGLRVGGAGPRALLPGIRRPRRGRRGRSDPRPGSGGERLRRVDNGGGRSDRRRLRDRDRIDRRSAR